MGGKERLAGAAPRGYSTKSHSCSWNIFLSNQYKPLHANIVGHWHLSTQHLKRQTSITNISHTLKKINNTYPISNSRLTSTPLRERAKIIHLGQYAVSVLLFDQGHQVDDVYARYFPNIEIVWVDGCWVLVDVKIGRELLCKRLRCCGSLLFAV